MMTDMLADMVKKALPPEVLDMLAPEKVKALGDQVNAFVLHTKEMLDALHSQNVRIEQKLADIAERMDNDRQSGGIDGSGSDGSTRRQRKPRGGDGGPASESDGNAAV